MQQTLFHHPSLPLAHSPLFPLDRRLSPRTHIRQLLAAQRFYLERADWDEIVSGTLSGHHERAEHVD
jgi:hypothetical protein